MAAGQAHTLFLVDPASTDFDKLETFEPAIAAEDAPPPAPAALKGAPCEKLIFKRFGSRPLLAAFPLLIPTLEAIRDGGRGGGGASAGDRRRRRKGCAPQFQPAVVIGYCLVSRDSDRI